MKRATCQRGRVYSQALLTTPAPPFPTSWSGRQMICTTKLDNLTWVLQSLLSCMCRRGCVWHCKCRNAALQCSALCLCEGDVIVKWRNAALQCSAPCLCEGDVIVNAGMLHFNAQLCACVKGSVIVNAGMLHFNAQLCACVKGSVIVNAGMLHFNAQLCACVKGM